MQTQPNNDRTSLLQGFGVESRYPIVSSYLAALGGLQFGVSNWLKIAEKWKTSGAIKGSFSDVSGLR